MPDNYGNNEATPKERERLHSWCHQAFQAADGGRRDRMDRFQRYYRLYRSYTTPRPKGDWRSRVFMPEAFQAVETILPRLVAQLPKFVVNPVGPEDVEPSKAMEFLLNHAAEQQYGSGSSLYAELVKVFKDALIYGTGVLKVYYDEVTSQRSKVVPILEDVVMPSSMPLIDPETNMPLVDPDTGQPVMQDEEIVVGQQQVGQETVMEPFVLYEGPVAEAVHLSHFWVAPEAEDIDSARYVIHRVYVPWDEVKRRIEEGIYHWEGSFEEFEARATETEDQYSSQARQADIGLGGDQQDDTRKDCEVMEFHTQDGRTITWLNRKVVVRVQRNAYAHGQKPFVRFVDHLMPHEFYGVGEIEAIEGLQDIVNALQNQRIDEVRLKMNKPFAGNPDLLVDLRDLEQKPGQFIRTRSDARPDEILKALDLGDVNPSAYMEVDAMQRMIERVTGVSSQQQGLDAAWQNETATGAQILSEMGASRFGFKTRVIEILSLKRLAKQMGSIIQQFTSGERVVRLLGPEGQADWATITPDALQGAFDFTIETSSIVQSETVRRQQADQVFQSLVPLLMSVPPGMTLPPGVQVAVEKLLESHGIKDIDRYLQPAPPPMPDPMALMMGEQMPPEQVA